MAFIWGTAIFDKTDPHGKSKKHASGRMIVSKGWLSEPAVAFLGDIRDSAGTAGGA